MTALRVIIDGKPASGKTTVSTALERSLNDFGIKTFDAKSDVLNGMFSNLLRRFEDTDIKTFRDLGRSVMYHAISYAALELSSWQNRNRYDVILLQRSPYSFIFALNATKLKEHQPLRIVPSDLLANILSAWSSVVKPDAYIYLKVEQPILEKRFNERKSGKDSIHTALLRQDDDPNIELLKQKLSNVSFYEEENSGPLEDTISRLKPIIMAELPRMHIKPIPMRKESGNRQT
ncbi:MAG: hypothetical protein JJ59_00135 [Candidatus Micrarchaeum sp. AZ1]|jgi:thymidylate kinase|nr:MAG: hypothetical protein JJ59_00135 [Candidatus Micrarchaeum sp. AZ1]